jgi:predicted nucleic acid-binding protein
MSTEGLLLDTVYVQALLNYRDQHHARALRFAPRVRSATGVWVTEAVLIEIGDALSGSNRAGAAAFIDSCYRTPNITVVPVDTPLLGRALRLYESHTDKEWGLTDCVSFVVMRDQQLVDALTADRHFRQAGFHALLLDADEP